LAADWEAFCAKILSLANYQHRAVCLVMFTKTNSSLVKVMAVLSLLAGPALACQTADTAQKAKPKPPHAADRVTAPQIVLETRR
jgi:hypothetical protein